MLDLRGLRVALLFPGQGSQMPGMGSGIYRRSARARRTFDRAEELLGIPLRRLCFTGSARDLEATEITQPATFVTSVAFLHALEELAAEAGEPLAPAIVAGHSLGHYAAMVAAGAIDFEDGLRAVVARAQAMRLAAERSPGAMAALVGLSLDQVEDVCASAREDGVLTIACHNAPAQHVLSGDPGCVERAIACALERGARSARRLAIGVASHSCLMDTAARAFEPAVAALRIRQPRLPLVLNLTGCVAPSVDAIRDDLRRHVTEAIRWSDTLRTIGGAGVDALLEVGPGHVLSELARGQLDVPVVSLGFLQPMEELIRFADDGLPRAR